MRAASWLAVLLLAVAGLPAPAVAAGWGSIEPGVTTQERVRDIYGPPTREVSKKIEGYDTTEWLYETARAPRGLVRMSVEFGFLATDVFKPTVVRTLRLEPKPMIFGRDTVVDGWGVPDRIAQQGAHDVFLYEAGLIVTFDVQGVSATTMLFLVPQKLPAGSR